MTEAATKTEPKPKAEAKTASAADVNAELAAGTAPADLKADAKFYCPGCGKRYDAETDCTGSSASAPHAPIAVVSTKELAGDEAKHTAAPDTD